MHRLLPPISSPPLIDALDALLKNKMHLTFESHIKEIPPTINFSFDMYVMTETLVGELLDQSMSVKDPRKNFHYSSFAASR